MAAQEKKRIRDTTSDRIFNIVIHTILIIFLILVIYPVYFVLIASVSDPTYVNSGDFLLYPKGFTLLGYQRVFQDDRIWVGYGNTLIYTILGTIQEVEEHKNLLTGEELYELTVNCNDLIYSICINKTDLLGEPLLGRRFKGNVWLQGTVHFTD